MSKRLNDWANEMIDDGLSEYDIACGLDNGDVARPEWLGSNPSTAIGYVIWDTNESDGTTHLYSLDTNNEEG